MRLLLLAPAALLALAGSLWAPVPGELPDDDETPVAAGGSVEAPAPPPLQDVAPRVPASAPEHRAVLVGNPPRSLTSSPVPESVEGTPRPKRTRLHPVDHHPDATPEERTKIDDLIQKAIFQDLGGDSRAAEHDLTAIGIKASPRLIDVFHTLQTGEGLDNDRGRTKAFITDRVLRSIDGHIERRRGRLATPIQPVSDVRHVEMIVGYWFAWWDTGLYETPEKPWIERFDGPREGIGPGK